MALQTMAPVLNKKPYQKGAYFPLNTQYLLGFNEPNKACVLRPCSLRRAAPARELRWGHPHGSRACAQGPGQPHVRAGGEAVAPGR